MRQADVQGFTSLLRDELTGHASRLFGLGALFGWLQLAFSVPQPEPLALPLSIHNQIWFLSLAVSALVFAFACFTPLVDKALNDNAFMLSLSAFSMTLGALGLLMSPVDIPMSYTVFFCILTGLGSSFLLLLWGAHLATLEIRRILIDMGITSVLTTAAVGLAVFVPRSVEIVFISIFPLATAWLLRISSRGASKQAVPTVPQSLPKSSLLYLAAFIGFIWGLMLELGCLFASITIQETLFATVLGILVSGGILFLVAIFFTRNNQLFTICRISLPLLATGFLLLPFFTHFIAVPLAVFTVGHSFFYSLLWVLSADRCQSTHQSPFRVFGASLLAFLGTSLLGTLCGSVLGNSEATNDHTLFVVSMALIYVVVLLFSLIIGKLNRETKNNEAQWEAELLRAGCETLGQKRGLSPREREILFLLASGEDRSAIREKLVLSPDTVKTHIRRIYAKLDVHSKDQLLKLVKTSVGQLLRGM